MTIDCGVAIEVDKNDFGYNVDTKVNKVDKNDFGYNVDTKVNKVDKNDLSNKVNTKVGTIRSTKSELDKIVE